MNNVNESVAPLQGANVSNITHTLNGGREVMAHWTREQVLAGIDIKEQQC